MIGGWKLAKNKKLGSGVPGFYTYSRSAIKTCPGASDWCRGKDAERPPCYADRMAQRRATNARSWAANDGDAIPPIPEDATLIRYTVSGDLSSVAHIRALRSRLLERPTVRLWAYTRSWRVKALRRELNRLRRDCGDRVQIFASMDRSIAERPPRGWRVAWLSDDDRAQGYACPEQDGRRPSCIACGYCFRGRKGDVVFTIH